MPKNCSVLNCRSESGSGERRSFYKFPLHDPARLQLWLTNMGRHNWTPSRHQYICHQHFTPSCFKVRWGIRYLEADAVPTVFEKRKAADQSGWSPKRIRGEENPGVTVSDAVEAKAAQHAQRLFRVSVDPSQQVGSGALELAEPQTDSDSSGGNMSKTWSHTAVDVSHSENAEVVVMSEIGAADGQEQLVSSITAAILGQGGALVPADPVLCCLEDSVRVPGVAYVAEDLPEDHSSDPLIAYFETIPNVYPGEGSTPVSFSPETVLSSALSSEPISSTVPITSKHSPPSPAPVVVTLQRLDVDGDDGPSEAEEFEQLDHQLEEHCYHRSSLSKAQLEAMVVQLQRKVKVLQQRHRRHLDKLLVLESTVVRLRQSSLLTEERLQLLERAYLQSAAAAPEPAETVAIIYEEDAAAFLYTPLNGSL